MAKQLALTVLLLTIAGCGSATAPVATADPLPEPAVENAAPGAAAAEPDAAAESTFAFPADGVGKHLEERLAPPRQAPLPPVPFVTEPKSSARPRSTMDAMPLASMCGNRRAIVRPTWQPAWSRAWTNCRKRCPRV